MSKPEYTVTQVSWTEEGLAIQYFSDHDLRAGGKVMAQHGLQLHAAHPDYRQDMELLHDLAVKILRNALDDYESSEPFKSDEIPEDDERGMGE